MRVKLKELKSIVEASLDDHSDVESRVWEIVRLAQEVHEMLEGDTYSEQKADELLQNAKELYKTLQYD